MAHVFIGTSGWNYKHWWNGVFYPKELKPPQWLQFFAQHFRTVEINNSFYRLPSPAAFQNWRQQVSRNFTFAVKASRFITHIKRLKDPEDPLDLFFSRARYLEDRLGPVLFQLPPKFKCDIERLRDFLRALRKHRLGKAQRCVLEVRDGSWLSEPVFDLLTKYHTALCFADWRDVSVTGPITADFLYIRRHSGHAADGNYSRGELNRDVQHIRAWLRHGYDVYMYFNNDWKGFAVENAEYVQRNLELRKAR